MGLAFGALAFSIALGVGLNALVTLTVRTLQAGQTLPAQVDLGSAPAVILLAGTFGACFAAALATWRIMAPVRSPYRQGMLSMVSFFGSFLVSMVGWPVDRAFGRPGLLGVALAAAGVLALAGRKIGREMRSL